MKTIKFWNPELVSNHSQLDGNTCTVDELNEWEYEVGCVWSTTIKVVDERQLHEIWNLVNNETNCELRYHVYTTKIGNIIP